MFDSVLEVTLNADAHLSNSIEKDPNILLVSGPQFFGVLHHNRDFSGIELVGVGVPEEMSERSEIIQELIALMGKKCRPHALDRDGHAPEQLQMILALVLDLVFEGMRNHFEQVFEGTVEIMDLIAHAFNGRSGLAAAPLIEFGVDVLNGSGLALNLSLQ